MSEEIIITNNRADGAHSPVIGLRSETIQDSAI